jgi:hypothetical protein
VSIRSAAEPIEALADAVRRYLRDPTDLSALADAGPVGPELHHAAMRSSVMKPLLLLAIELRGAGKSAPTLQRVLPFSRPVETVSAPWLPRSSNRW